MAQNIAIKGNDPVDTLYKNVKYVDRGFLLGGQFHSIEESTCLLWTGPKREGYGIFSQDGREYLAHRLAVEEEWGYRPRKLRNTCGERSCIVTGHWEETAIKSHPSIGTPKAHVVHYPDYGSWRVRFKVCGEILVEYYYPTEQSARRAEAFISQWASGYDWKTFENGIPQEVKDAVPGRIEAAITPIRGVDF